VIDRKAAVRIRWQLKIVAELVEHAETRRFWNLTKPESELAADDALLHPDEPSHYVSHCLAVAIDALRSAHTLLSADDGSLRVSMVGQYPLLRTAMESAALASWLLQPDDQIERLTRLLRARWDEILHDDRAARAFAGSDSEDAREDRSYKAKLMRDSTRALRARKNQLRELARRVGVREVAFSGGLPGFGPVIRDAARGTGVRGSQAYGAWCILSGLTHPSVSRSISLSDLEIIHTDGDVHQVRATTRLDIVSLALDAALGTYLDATGLTARRGGDSTVRWQPPPGFPMPPNNEALRL